MVSKGWLTIAIFMVSLWAPDAVVKLQLAGFRIGGVSLGTNFFAGEPKIKNRVVKEP